MCMPFGPPLFTRHCKSFSLREAKRFPNQIADGDSDKKLWGDGHVEETFVAEEDTESPEEAP